MADELMEFLDLMHFVIPNLNDTFDYACADSERLYMDGIDDEEEGLGNQEMLVKMFREYGHDGIIAFCAKVRGRPPLRQLRTKEYEMAMLEMEDWKYWDD